MNGLDNFGPDEPDLPGDSDGSRDPFRVWLIAGVRECLRSTRSLEKRVQRIENLLWLIGALLALVVPIVLGKVAGISVAWGGSGG